MQRRATRGKLIGDRDHDAMQVAAMKLAIKLFVTDYKAYMADPRAIGVCAKFTARVREAEKLIERNPYILADPSLRRVEK